ncbi:hypothetical protein SSX86_029347 [Deinandra increscens subsp. villosa]|uniref:Coilin n=1 Tax=Deinandra increscens subsp. villosa TaxID=3103831 RepID=A0AAP0CFH5_9ASTR
MCDAPCGCIQLTSCLATKKVDGGVNGRQDCHDYWRPLIIKVFSVSVLYVTHRSPSPTRLRWQGFRGRRSTAVDSSVSQTYHSLSPSQFFIGVRVCAESACKMGTPSLRVRLVFEDRSILTKTQRSDGMNHTWILLKLQQHRTISDVCTYLLHIFKLHHSCPNGIMLSMEGFALPPFESTEILKEKEIICVKKKGGSTTDAGNLLDDVEPGDDGLLLLANDNFDKGTKEYTGESEEFDEEQSKDEELPEETISKKRKASTNLPNLKKKKQCLAALGDDAETEETENINNDASHPMKISRTKETNKIAAPSNKKVKSSSTVKRSEELQENVAEVKQVSNAKLPSRSARRKKAKRHWMQELAKIGKKKPKQAYSKPEITKPENKEANDQPKGLLYWKQASKKPMQNGDVGTDVGPVVTRPGRIRYGSLDEDQAAKQTGVSTEKIKWNGSSCKKKDHKWGREEFSTFRGNDHTKKLNLESLKTLFKDSKVPIIDPNDFDKLPPCSEPKEGDVIAYRLLELNSSWVAEFSSFRVGRISYYDAKDIVLVPVTEYLFVSEKNNEDDGPNDSLYGEDGTLEINYSALVDVRNVMQYDPNVTEPISDGVDQIPMSDSKDAAENLVSNSNGNNIDVAKDSNAGGVSPWDRFISKNTEIPEPNNPSMVGSGLNTSSYGGAGPSTSTVLDANKAESSKVKEGQSDNSTDPWLSANKTDRSQENNSGWSNVLGPTTKDCENGSSWGRPWSAFAVSRGSSAIQQNKDNGWHAESSRGSWKPTSRGAPRGRGRGRGFSRGRGRNGN